MYIRSYQTLKKVMYIEDINGPSHTKLVNKAVKDIEMYEYVINSFVDVNLYQKIY
jgi:hypothetical protein